MTKKTINNTNEEQVKRLLDSYKKASKPIRCPKCNYPLVLFKSRRQYQCSRCRKVFPQRKLELEVFLDYNRRWEEKKKAAWRKATSIYQINRKRLKGSKKKYREKNKNKLNTKRKQYYQKNKDKLNANRKKYYSKNKELIRNHLKKYRLRNKDEIKTRYQSYSIRNREESLAILKNSKVQEMDELNKAFDVYDIPYHGEGCTIGYYVYHLPNYKRFEITDDKNIFKDVEYVNIAYLVAAVVSHGKYSILEVVPINPLDNFEKIFDDSLKRVKKKIKIKIAFFDRRFYDTKLIKIMERNNIKFIIHTSRNPYILSYYLKDSCNICNARVIEDFFIKGKNECNKVNLIFVKDKIGFNRAFICNFNIAPCIAYRIFDLYKYREDIEKALIIFNIDGELFIKYLQKIKHKYSLDDGGGKNGKE